MSTFTVRKPTNRSRSRNVVSRRKKKSMKASVSFKKAYQSLLPPRYTLFSGQLPLYTDDATGINFVIQNVYVLVAGVQLNQREANKIHATIITSKITAINESSTRVRGLRHVIIQPKSATKGDADPTLDEIMLTSTFVATPPTRTAFDSTNRVNIEKFNVYHDKTYKLAPSTQGGSCIVKTVKTKINRTLEYNQADALDSNPNNPIYSIYFVFAMDDNQPAIAAATWLTFQTQAYFKNGK